MEIKGALTMIHETRDTKNEGCEDLRYYLECPLRKGRPRIAVTVCHKQKCIWLTSDGGKMKCGYGDPKANLSNRPKVKKISRDGVI